MPPAFCHPIPNEIAIGAIYGMVALLALIRSDVSSWREVVWLAVVVASGHGVLHTCAPFLTSEPFVTLNQLFVLGLLAVSCRFAAELNRRFDGWNQTNRNRSAGQFGIGGLLWLTTCVAIVIFLMKQTTLVDRNAVYWVGLLIFIALFSIAFSRHPVALVFVAGLLAFGLAIVDAHGVQPEALGFRAAMIRYTGLVFGMILPRLIFNQSTLRLLQSSFVPKPSADAPTTLNPDRDDVPANIARINHPLAHTEKAVAGPVVAGVTAVDQAGPAFRVVC